MVSQGRVKLLSGSEHRCLENVVPPCGGEEGRREEGRLKRNHTYSSHSHQLTKLPPRIFNPKALVLKTQKQIPQT